MCVITSSKLDEALYNMLKLLHFSLVHLYLDEITQVLLPLGENYDRDLTKWTFFLFFLMTNLFSRIFSCMIMVCDNRDPSFNLFRSTAFLPNKTRGSGVVWRYARNIQLFGLLEHSVLLRSEFCG